MIGRRLLVAEEVARGLGTTFRAVARLLAWGTGGVRIAESRIGVSVEESVELATVYLVDLVGSTRLATSVGPVRADELMREYFGLLREAIGTCGGKEFKDTGDGLFAAFSSASAGVRCAVLTHQLFERRYRGAEQQLHVRIGLGTGESTLRDGGWFGMPSIEAARLCDQAPADGILVSPMTKMRRGGSRVPDLSRWGSWS